MRGDDEMSEAAAENAMLLGGTKRHLIYGDIIGERKKLFFAHSQKGREMGKAACTFMS